MNRDQQGLLWLATNVGIWAYESTNEQLYRFRKEDGLPSDQFYLNADCKTADGKIWLGTDNGALVFQPESIAPYPFGPTIFIDALKVNQQDFITTITIDALKEISLQQEENTMDIRVLGLTSYFTQVDKNSFIFWKAMTKTGRK